MKKKLFNLPIYLVFLPTGVAVCLIILGSFFDLEISKNIADIYSLSGKISQSFGAILGYLLGPLSGALVFLYLNNQKNIICKVFAWILILISIVMPGYIMVKEMSSETNTIYSISLSKPLAYLIGYGSCLTTCLICYFCFKSSDQKLLFICGISIAAVILLSLATQTALKSLIGRPRYRYMLVNDCFNEYRDWWQLIGETNGKLTDNFKSCPSGHAATCFSTLSVIVLSKLAKPEKQNLTSLILFICSFAYGLIVATSRLTSGAHFLSDVGLGALIGSLYSVIVPIIAFKIL